MNLEQVRARNALAVTDTFRGDNNGEIVKKIPTRIRANGFLAAAAFAMDKGGAHLAVFEKAILPHLRELKKTEQPALRSFIAELCAADSTKLRDVTSESLAYLNYLRRFVE